MGGNLHLLIADDSASDIYLFKQALREHATSPTVHTVADGQAAIDFLRRQGCYSNVPTIDLLVLDINMPKRTGHEVLQEIKGDPDLKAIPVVILTSSSHHQDVARAYEQSVNCYIEKPTDWESWARVVRAIEGFWCNRVSLPTQIDSVSGQLSERTSELGTATG